MARYQLRLPFHLRLRQVMNQAGSLGRDLRAVRQGWGLSDYEFGMLMGQTEHPQEWVRRVELGLLKPKCFVKDWVQRQLLAQQIRHKTWQAVRNFRRERGMCTREDVARFAVASLARLRAMGPVQCWDPPKLKKEERKRIKLEPGTGLV